jgi:hypothetical protein
MIDGVSVAGLLVKPWGGLLKELFIILALTV